MVSIQKYKRANILLSPELESAPEEVRNLFQELDVFERELSEIEKQVAAVDDSCLVLTKEIHEATDAIAQLGILGTSKMKYGGQVGGAIGIVAAVAKTYGDYVGKKRSAEAHEKAEAAKALMKERKKAIANTKLTHIREVRESLSTGCSKQIALLYEREFNKSVSINVPINKSKIGLFIKSLSLVTKARFLNEAMDYYITSMEAWEKGKNPASRKRPSLENELSKELSSWDKIIPESTSWEGYINMLASQANGSCPLPVAALLSNPCLLRNYVGINIGTADNCPAAMIRLTPGKEGAANPLITNNPYYLHCQDILKNDYQPPRKRRGFGIEDFLILLAIPAVFFGLTVLDFKLEHSTFWRVFWMLPILCWTGLGIEFLDNNIERLFPFISRQEDYDAENREFQQSVRRAEDKADFHLLA